MKKATGGDNPYLPPEIIIDILKRLRVKLLLRFRAVCKDWRNLLKSPYFIEEHYHHSAHKSPLLICRVSNRNPIYSPLCFLRYEKETIEALRLPVMDSLRRVIGIIGSSNGLLCVKLGDAKDDTPPSLLLYNPATKNVRQVPRSTNDDGSPCQYGFGYNPVVRDYKIVRIRRIRINGQINLENIWVDRVEVYSLRTGSWKEVEFGVIKGTRDLFNPFAVNGAIFWIGWEVEYHRRVIISFDLAMEVFALISIPPSAFVAPFNQYVLDVYEDKVAMIHLYVHESSHAFEYTSFDLWLLEERSDAYEKSWGWSKKYCSGPTSPFVFPICFLWMNEIVCYDHIDRDFLFNLTAKKKIYSSLSTGDMIGRFFFYAESLASIG